MPPRPVFLSDFDLPLFSKIFLSLNNDFSLNLDLAAAAPGAQQVYDLLKHSSAASQVYDLLKYHYGRSQAVRRQPEKKNITMAGLRL